MYLWRKHGQTAALEASSSEARELTSTVWRNGARDRSNSPETGGDLAPESRARQSGKRRALVRELGGSARNSRGEWLQDFAKRAQTKPLRIGSRLTVVETTPAKNNEADPPAQSSFRPKQPSAPASTPRPRCACACWNGHTRKLPAGWSMLDAGTGSGILAIAARCLGAARVLAIDNDPLACAIAKRNARANGVRNIEFRTSDVLKLKLTNKFDVITANLFSEILIRRCPNWSRAARPRRLLDFVRNLAVAGKGRRFRVTPKWFRAQEVRRRGKWVALLALPARKNS